ncbi:hypothetical protein I317_00322 [Kwoniella heveanensis CBS 569]|nr:hypothetical protein I317_00322 [Kwoniella heveanensis CBS 569]
MADVFSHLSSVETGYTPVDTFEKTGSSIMHQAYPGSLPGIRNRIITTKFSSFSDDGHDSDTDSDGGGRSNTPELSDAGSETPSANLFISQPATPIDGVITHGSTLLSDVEPLGAEQDSERSSVTFSDRQLTDTQPSSAWVRNRPPARYRAWSPRSTPYSREEGRSLSIDAIASTGHSKDYPAEGLDFSNTYTSRHEHDEILLPSEQAQEQVVSKQLSPIPIGIPSAFVPGGGAQYRREYMEGNKHEKWGDTMRYDLYESEKTGAISEDERGQEQYWDDGQNPIQNGDSGEDQVTEQEYSQTASSDVRPSGHGLPSRRSAPRSFTPVSRKERTFERYYASKNFGKPLTSDQPSTQPCSGTNQVEVVATIDEDDETGQRDNDGGGESPSQSSPRRNRGFAMRSLVSSFLSRVPGIPSKASPMARSTSAISPAERPVGRTSPVSSVSATSQTPVDIDRASPDGTDHRHQEQRHSPLHSRFSRLTSLFSRPRKSNETDGTRTEERSGFFRGLRSHLAATATSKKFEDASSPSDAQHRSRASRLASIFGLAGPGRKQTASEADKDHNQWDSGSGVELSRGAASSERTGTGLSRLISRGKGLIRNSKKGDRESTSPTYSLKDHRVPRTSSLFSGLPEDWVTRDR